MYKIVAYDYPQCCAGLTPLLNCKIVELSEEWQPRKDGNSGFDVLVPFNPFQVSLAKFTKDDVRKEEFLVFIKDEIIWEVHWSRRGCLGEGLIEYWYVRNEQEYKGPLPKEIKLLRRYVETFDIDEKRRIIEELRTPPERENCLYYSEEILKCGVNPTSLCRNCKEYEYGL